MAEHTRYGYFIYRPRNESMEDIARKFGVSAAALYDFNGGRKGDAVLVPYPGPQLKSHVVGRSERLHDLIRRYSMTIKEFSRLNPGVDIFNLKEGTKVSVRDNNTPGPGTHVVAPGENVNAAAKRLGVSVTSLLKANPHLYPNEFTEGTVIKLRRK